MGCWCETDGITQLPIRAGDKVRLFVLANQGEPEGGGQCYNNELWAPIGPPIQGSYDDYGGIEDIIKSPDNDLILEKIKSNWAVVEEEYDKAPSLKEMTLEKVLYLIERDRARFINYKGKEVPYGFMMIHEDIYQAMLSFNPIESHHDYETRSWMYMPQHESLKLEVDNWYIKTLGRYKDSIGLDNKFAEIMLDMSDGRLFSDYRESAIKLYKKTLSDFIRKQTSIENEEVQRILKVSTDMLIFNMAMYRARKLWQPQCGKGSQTNETDIYNILADATLKLTSVWQKQDEEDGYEAPDAEGYSSYMREHNAKVLAESKDGTQKV